MTEQAAPEQLAELAYYAVTHHPADARKIFTEATDAGDTNPCASTPARPPASDTRPL